MVRCTPHAACHAGYATHDAPYATYHAHYARATQGMPCGTQGMPRVTQTIPRVTHGIPCTMHPMPVVPRLLGSFLVPIPCTTHGMGRMTVLACMPLVIKGMSSILVAIARQRRVPSKARGHPGSGAHHCPIPNGVCSRKKRCRVVTQVVVHLIPRTIVSPRAALSVPRLAPPHSTAPATAHPG